MQNSFYTELELKKFGFKELGRNVLISKKASIYSPKNIKIGNNVRIDDFCILSGKIEIGNFIHIAPFCSLIGGKEGIVIEDFANVSHRVSIFAISDDFSGNFLTNPTVADKYKKLQNGKVLLKKHSIIGTGTVILPNITINEGASVGALSLVKNNLDAWFIYAGIPAKKIKPRSRKLLELEENFLQETSHEPKT